MFPNIFGRTSALNKLVSVNYLHAIMEQLLVPQSERGHNFHHSCEGGSMFLVRRGVWQPPVRPLLCNFSETPSLTSVTIVLVPTRRLMCANPVAHCAVRAGFCSNCSARGTTTTGVGIITNHCAISKFLQSEVSCYYSWISHDSNMAAAVWYCHSIMGLDFFCCTAFLLTWYFLSWVLFSLHFLSGWFSFMVGLFFCSLTMLCEWPVSFISYLFFVVSRFVISCSQLQQSSDGVSERNTSYSFYHFQVLYSPSLITGLGLQYSDVSLLWLGATLEFQFSHDYSRVMIYPALLYIQE